jgi:uncharacterized protein (TIGR00299 family) protein
MIGLLDLPSGLSGDMFLGCLVDAGYTVERLRQVVARLGLEEAEWSVSARSVMKGPFRATLVDVQTRESGRHRHLRHVREIVENADLPRGVADRSLAVFERLAAAEAKVHGSTAEQVHFHEVGAADALIDIVGTVAGLSELGVERLYAGAVPLGEGWAESAHGAIPVPAPGTLEILAAAHAKTRPAPGPGELVTPTGAALLSELASFGAPSLALERVGVGAGRRDYAWPNLARLLLGREDAGELAELQTNIDDMNPQLFASVSEQLFQAGARDVWLTPVQMKKGRPGVLLSALVPARDQARAAELILRHTTTLGVRVRPLSHRYEARREIRSVDTPYGGVRVKLKWVGEELVGASPEYDDCAELAQKNAAAARDVYDSAAAAALELLRELRGARSRR